MNTSSAVDERLRSLEFDLKLQDPRIQSMNQLRDCIQRINNLFVQKKFKGVLFALTHELVSNAFKAMYKRQFYQYLLTQQKTDFIPEEKWIGDFQEALEAGNLDRYIAADRSNFYVQISGRLSRRVFTVEVRNPGVPSRIELARIETFIR
ncbi:MAG: hypothetical protein KDK30_04885, partial [Leptospiraceae bacterium]|nr:hypothetical protein [Leptospiraceae bacterium]